MPFLTCAQKANLRRFLAKKGSRDPVEDRKPVHRGNGSARYHARCRSLGLLPGPASVEAFGNWPVSQMEARFAKTSAEPGDRMAEARKSRLIGSLLCGLDVHVDFAGVFGHSTCYRLMDFAAKWFGLAMPPLSSWLSTYRGA